MQQFTPYFPGYDNQQQQQAQGEQQQQPLSLNGPNLAIYTPAAMQPLSVLAAAQKREQQQLQAQQPQQQQQQVVMAESDIGAHGKPKRKQVKNACVNCQKACKKCDIGRPCQRCIKYGLTDTCINSVRKERKKGVKRGPYKKRNKSESGNTSSGASTPNMQSPMTYNATAANANARATAGTTTTSQQSSSIPIHYQSFPMQGHYGIPYGYGTDNSQMMPQAYAVPTNMQNLYQANPAVLSYHQNVVMANMMNPNQQQQQQTNYGISGTQSPNNNNEAAATNEASVKAEPNAATTSAEEEADKDKLNMLSQLCSAVLERTDNSTSKPEETNGIKTDAAAQGSTPPPSRPHSRETSEHNFGTDSPHTYVNGHLQHRNANMYATTPSPTDSPTIDHFNKEQQQQQWTAAPTQQQD